MQWKFIVKFGKTHRHWRNQRGIVRKTIYDNHTTEYRFVRRNKIRIPEEEEEEEEKEEKEEKEEEAEEEEEEEEDDDDEEEEDEEERRI